MNEREERRDVLSRGLADLSLSLAHSFPKWRAASNQIEHSLEKKKQPKTQITDAAEKHVEV